MGLDEITSHPLNPRCMRCILDKFLNAAPANAPWQVRSDYMRAVLATVSQYSETMTAPEVTHELTAVRERFFGAGSDLSQEKRHFNELMLGMEDQLADRIRTSADPLEQAIRYTLAGNFIDFGQSYAIDDQTILGLLGNAAHMPVDTEALAELQQHMKRAGTIAFIADNCGEVVLDKLLILEILRANPDAQVTVIVRGAAASNDATLEDACQVGLDRVCRVIGNGNDVAGTCLQRVNDETRAAIGESDLVISKGLANYETLMGRGRNTWFLFLCKCAFCSDLFDMPLQAGLIVRGV